MTAPRIYIIAGEASGDALGGKLVRALRAALPDAVIRGVGGERMQAQGVPSQFPMHEISHMGFVEYLPHLPVILARLRQTLADIRAFRPDVLVTIDAPGFNKRVVAALQEMRGAGMACVHYVAPTVWAYRPERAKRFAALFDHLLVLLPFEPPYFEQEGLACTFVGHPVLEDAAEGDGAAFRRRHGMEANAPLLCVLPGSRRGELRHHIPPFRGAAGQLAARVTGLRVAILAGQGLEDRDYGLPHWPGQPVLVRHEEKADMLAAADVALAKSGTVTLEVAHAGVPLVMGYRAGAISMRMIRRMTRIRFANLMNILHDREVVPELIQEACRPDILARELYRLLTDDDARQRQQKDCLEALAMLRPASGMPSEMAAGAIAALAARHHSPVRAGKALSLS